MRKLTRLGLVFGAGVLQTPAASAQAYGPVGVPAPQAGSFDPQGNFLAFSSNARSCKPALRASNRDRLVRC